MMLAGKGSLIVLLLIQSSALRLATIDYTLHKVLDLTDFQASSKQLYLQDLLDALVLPPYLPFSAWHEHIPFAMYITAKARPRLLVELGTHYGVSYCAFCEAALVNRLDAHFYAIDTWHGDAHASFYGEEVYEELSAFHNKRYGAFSTLIRKTFEESLSFFSDGSIDLIHIDGYHSYEATRANFEDWLPKMSTRGIMLFHDTTVRRDNFGVWQLWEELAATYPAFNFEHGHGLGVLFVGDTYPGDTSQFFELNEDDARVLRQFFSYLGRRWSVEYAQNKLSEKYVSLETAYHKAKQDVSTLRTSLESSELSLSEHRLVLKRHKHVVNEKDAAISKKQADIIRLQKKLATAEARLSEAQRSAERQEEHYTSQLALLQHNATTGRFSSNKFLKVMVPGRLWNALRWRRHIELVRRSGLVNAVWYIQQNPDVAAEGIDPVEHYVRHGVKDGRDPNPHFDTEWYLRHNLDVAMAGQNPLVHYIKYGEAEGRDPSYNFNVKQYKAQHPQVDWETTTALRYYMVNGGVSSTSFSLQQATSKVVEPKRKVLLDYTVRQPQQVVANLRYYSENKGRNNRIAVYSAIVDSYDHLILPEKPSPNIDYYCFSNSPLPDYGIFNIRPIDYFANDSTRTARYIKTHPHIYLENYDIVIWLDANVIVHDDILPMVEAFIQSGKSIAGIPHPLRDSVYEEAEACKSLGKDDVRLIEEQMRTYHAADYKGNYLLETNFMMFNLKDERVVQFLSTWWAQIDRHSRRDQLSIGYALKLAELDVHYIFPKGKSVRDYDGFSLLEHRGKPNIDNDNYRTKNLNIKPLFVQPLNHDKSYLDIKLERLSQYDDVSVDIVICIHNALDDVRICLDSVVATRRTTDRVILINDGSDKETSAYLRAFSEDHNHVLLGESSIATGYTRAVNRGLQLSTADFVILLNSDTIVPEQWVEKLTDAAFGSKNVGIVGPLSNAASHQSIPNHKSLKNQTAINKLPENISLNEMNRLCEAWTPADILPRVPLVHGFCFCIRREVINAIGLMDEENFPEGYGEENDYCFRAVDAGFGLAIATHTYIFHAKSKSYTNDERRVQLMQNGSQILRKLHTKERIRRAIISMAENPLLQKYRQHTKALENEQIKQIHYPSFLQSQSQKIRIGLFVQWSGKKPTSSAYIRLLSPLTSYPVSNHVTIELLYATQLEAIAQYDACIVQRIAMPSVDAAEQLNEHLQHNNIPLIVDNDDAFLAMDPLHPDYVKYPQLGERISALHELMKGADIVWFSTEQLGMVYQSLLSDYVVVPNSVDSRLWKSWQLASDVKTSLPLHMLYMGTQTHGKDFNMILLALDELNMTRPGSFTLTLIGVLDEEEMPKRPWIRFLKVPSHLKHYPQFVKWFGQHYEYIVGLAPLIDNVFNRCKSDIKFLDYSAFGVFPVVSDTYAYRIDENLSDYAMFVNNTTLSWSNALHELVRNPAQYLGTISDAQKYVLTNRNSMQIGLRQLQMIQSILS